MCSNKIPHTGDRIKQTPKHGGRDVDSFLVNKEMELQNYEQTSLSDNYESKRKIFDGSTRSLDIERRFRSIARTNPSVKTYKILFRMFQEERY
jgi:hypothetical protein